MEGSTILMIGGTARMKPESPRWKGDSTRRQAACLLAAKKILSIDAACLLAAKKILSIDAALPTRREGNPLD